jgi:hypothetical protein
MRTIAFAILSLCAALPARADLLSTMAQQNLFASAQCVGRITPVRCQSEIQWRHLNVFPLNDFGLKAPAAAAICQASVTAFTHEGGWKVFPLRALGRRKSVARAELVEMLEQISVLPLCR